MSGFKGVIGRTIEESTPWWPPVNRPAPHTPSVVMVVLDDVGFAQLGCYGSNIRTPNMDSLAATGVRYTNFHTTALCSPTRACLLTGRNHHSVGMGTLSNWDTGFPGNSGEITRRAGTVAEILRAEGFNTFAVGKWHLTPPDQQSPAGPFDQWPLQRGFERYYGFLDAATSQWDPELTSDNHRIETPEDRNCHLSEELVDQSIDFLRNQISWAPDRPFFLYLAFGACHEPHHAPADVIDRYRGAFDQGWDVCREEWLARQKEMGIVPNDTSLPQRNPGVRAWADLSVPEKKLFARLQETFAGMMEHADAQIGRLIDFLEEAGRRDNTMVMLVSDNGASQEGSQVGTFNTMRGLNGIPDSVEDNIANMDTFGTPKGNSNYPLGWAMAGNTPCKWYKKNTHGGGIRDPLIISWPDGIEARDEVRSQFHHATDVVPTILDVTRTTAPSTLGGIAQMPIEGVSMRYTFAAADEPSRKATQYFEIVGHRGIYSDGWKAVTHHETGASLDSDSWELYHLDSDFSESKDLAPEHPERLKELVDLWWTEAAKYNVLPLDDRGYERWLAPPRSGSIKDRHVFHLYSGIGHVGNDTAPDLRDISHAISAQIERQADDDGVIVAHGGCSGGYSLFIQNGHLVYHYNFAGTPYRFASARPIPTGILTVRMEYERTARCQGQVSLYVDDSLVGGGHLPQTLPYSQSLEGLDVGADRLTPVSDDYESPFRFAGKMDRVTIEVGQDCERDPAGEAASRLAKS